MASRTLQLANGHNLLEIMSFDGGIRLDLIAQCRNNGALFTLLPSKKGARNPESLSMTGYLMSQFGLFLSSYLESAEIAGPSYYTVSTEDETPSNATKKNVTRKIRELFHPPANFVEPMFRMQSMRDPSEMW